MKEIASLFFKLGLIAFGGPAAHIAMMETEVVARRKWMDRQHFLDLVGATNLIPGPNSTEMAIHCGYHRGGLPGLFVAGAAFILPAVVITLVFAWLYVTYGSIPAVEPFFFGIKPAVLAVILSAVYRLGAKALKGWTLGVLGAGVLTASLLGVSEIASLLAGGVVGALWLTVSERFSSSGPQSPSFVLFTGSTWKAVKSSVLSISATVSGAAAVSAVSGLKLFWVFLKVGSILFGSGYVLVAYLDAELVNRLAWLTRSELLDAIAIGQFTPGPVLSASTFVGYQILGVPGALVSTLGIFLPSFVFVLVLNPIVPRLRDSRVTANFLDAVNISAVAIMVAVVAKMGAEILLDWKSVFVGFASLLLVFGVKKLHTGWIILLGALLGYLLSFI